jgi:hypothetical protein
MANKPRSYLGRVQDRRDNAERLSKTPEGRAELARLEAERAAEVRSWELAEEKYQRRWGWLSRLLRPVFAWWYKGKEF